MTYMSLKIRDYGSPLSQTQLEAADLDNAVLQSLSSYARKCGPYDLQRWAMLRGLAIFYVDNCWLRVPVKGLELRGFCREMLGAEPTDVGLDARIADADSYLIEAGEF